MSGRARVSTVLLSLCSSLTVLVCMCSCKFCFLVLLLYSCSLCGCLYSSKCAYFCVCVFVRV